MIAEPVLEKHRYTTFPAERAMLISLLYQTRYLALKYTAMVEIGAFEGETTEVLARHQDGRPFYVIDPWDGTQDGSGETVYAKFLARMGKRLTVGEPYHGTTLATPPITIWRQRSQDVTPPPDLGFVFHDGDHRDPSDFRKWYDALVPGGILVVHDVSEPGWPKVRESFVETLGPPWHEYQYHATVEEHGDYGPAVRGLGWKVKPR